MTHRVRYTVEAKTAIDALPAERRALLASRPSRRCAVISATAALRAGIASSLALIASHEGGEACVCDLTDPFDVSQPTISHHLKVLREAGLVGSERRGTWVYYWVLPAALAKLSALLQTPAGTVPATGGGGR
ncbi:metalloregulator ArsR/SmtB family transcription factor [Kitasatospora aureofaciens]|uniref:ArsR/SmtB family transcription factor n=1 Tax=Kitasatospora aureofaciens TaxID=1894 RepID=UPI0033DBDFA0